MLRFVVVKSHSLLIGHTMLSMEEQRILQSLERLDAKLKGMLFNPLSAPLA